MVDRTHAALERARAAGTTDAADRSRQYNDPSNAAILEACNQAWTKIRLQEKKSAEDDKQIIETLKKKLERERLYRFITMGALIVAWEVIKLLATQLLHH